MGIDEARVKLERARKHIREFEPEFIEFLESDPYRVQMERHRRQPYRYRAHLMIRNTPKEHWGLTIGDAIHNLRCSLDYLVWQLSLQVTDRPSRDTEFPIFETRPSGEAFRKRVKHLPTKAREIIRSMQPYHGGDKARLHKLYVIHALDNADKHRRLSVVALGLNLSFEYRGEVLTPPTIWGPFYDGQTVQIRARPMIADIPAGFGNGDEVWFEDDPDAEVNAQAQPVIGVLFDDSGQSRRFQLYPTNELRDLFLHVHNRVFPRLEPFFKQQTSAGKG